MKVLPYAVAALLSARAIKFKEMEDTNPFDGTAVFLLSDQTSYNVQDKNQFGDAKATI